MYPACLHERYSKASVSSIYSAVYVIYIISILINRSRNTYKLSNPFINSSCKHVLNGGLSTFPGFYHFQLKYCESFCISEDGVCPQVTESQVLVASPFIYFLLITSSLGSIAEAPWCHSYLRIILSAHFAIFGVWLLSYVCNHMVTSARSLSLSLFQQGKGRKSRLSQKSVEFFIFHWLELCQQIKTFNSLFIHILFQIFPDIYWYM